MTSQLNAYLNFDGNAREALEFYRSCLGGELLINTFGEFGDETNPNGVMHGQLDTPDGFVLMASDLPPGMSMEITPAHHISLCLNGDDEENLTGYFHKLAEGGQVHVALEKQMWGDLFGQLVDRYGITWMANITPAA